MKGKISKFAKNRILNNFQCFIGHFLMSIWDTLQKMSVLRSCSSGIFQSHFAFGGGQFGPSKRLRNWFGRCCCNFVQGKSSSMKLMSPPFDWLPDKWYKQALKYALSRGNRPVRVRRQSRGRVPQKKTARWVQGYLFVRRVSERAANSRALRRGRDMAQAWRRAFEYSAIPLVTGARESAQGIDWERNLDADTRR